YPYAVLIFAEHATGVVPVQCAAVLSEDDSHISHMENLSVSSVLTRDSPVRGGLVVMRSHPGGHRPMDAHQRPAPRAAGTTAPSLSPAAKSRRQPEVGIRSRGAAPRGGSPPGGAQVGLAICSEVLRWGSLLGDAQVGS